MADVALMLVMRTVVQNLVVDRWPRMVLRRESIYHYASLRF